MVNAIGAAPVFYVSLAVDVLELHFLDGLAQGLGPADAIAGAKKEPHVIDQDKCIKCRVCFESCPDKWAAVVIS